MDIFLYYLVSSRLVSSFFYVAGRSSSFGLAWPRAVQYGDKVARKSNAFRWRFSGCTGRGSLKAYFCASTIFLAKESRSIINPSSSPSSSPPSSSSSSLDLVVCVVVLMCFEHHRSLKEIRASHVLSLAKTKTTPGLQGWVQQNWLAVVQKRL